MPYFSVTDVANGSNDSDSESGDESNDDFAIELEITKVPPSTAPQPPKTSNVNLASSKLAKKANAVKQIKLIMTFFRPVLTGPF